MACRLQQPAGASRIVSETHKPAPLIGDWITGDTWESLAVIAEQYGATLQVPKPDIS